MAVYTPVTLAEASALAARLGIGAVTALSPCSGGIENTNYFLDTSENSWVLTVFERLSAEQLPYYLSLMQHLANSGLAVPAPRADTAGQLLHSLHGKPAALVNRLSGKQNLEPRAQHCAAVGAFLARMHLAVGSFALRQPHLRGLDWWTRTAPEVLPYLHPGDASLLRDELAHQEQLANGADYAALPRGAIHADLFRDNAMFDGDDLTGVFDFYFAGDDAFIFDMAVSINDWCIDLATGTLNLSRARAMAQAYAQVRPLDAPELALLPDFLRAAALRFWLSRLRDWHLPRPAEVLTAHDPDHFERVLRARREAPVNLGELGLVP